MTRILAGAVALSFSLLALPAVADPPPGRGPGQGPVAAAMTRERGGPDVDIVVKFPARDVAIVRDYYARRDFCPPGLAKKRNGCLPPGQAKKWALGRPLPRDVIFHDLPPDLLGRLAPAPRGTRYVRVDNDILKIAVGTGLVLDAIEGLGRRG
jgi:hypothetical protein